MLKEALESGEIFYVMGVPRRQSRSILEHETAHALYYTNKTYRKTMLAHGLKLSKRVRKQIFTKLKSMGYSDGVKYDEVQAYMSTSRVADLIHWFGKGITVNHAKPFKATFKKYFR
jgi:hypothetical protein